MSAAEGGKSDLTDDLLSLPRFRVIYEPCEALKTRVIQGESGAIPGVSEEMVTKIFEQRDFHGHVFTVHVENVDVYAKPCPGKECSEFHLDDRVLNFLRPRNIHVIGYDHAGVFRIQVPRFCEKREAEEKVKMCWTDMLRMLVNKRPGSPKAAPQAVPTKPKPECRHG